MNEENQEDIEFNELIEMLAAANSRVREDAAHDLVWFGNRAIEPLTQLLKDEDKGVRIQAIESLGKTDFYGKIKDSASKAIDYIQQQKSN